MVRDSPWTCPVETCVYRFRRMTTGQLEQFEGAATIEKVAALCRRRAFVFPSSDIYGGLGSSFDFGPYRGLLDDHGKDEGRRAVLRERHGIVAPPPASLP